MTVNWMAFLFILVIRFKNQTVKKYTGQTGIPFYFLYPEKVGDDCIKEGRIEHQPDFLI